MSKIEILESWRVIDKWWRPEDEQIRNLYLEVNWNGRIVIFRQTRDDSTWRIVNLKKP